MIPEEEGKDELQCRSQMGQEYHKKTRRISGLIGVHRDELTIRKPAWD